MGDEYLCPEPGCGERLRDSADYRSGRDQDDNIWPAMGRLHHGAYGRGDDAVIVPVVPIPLED